MPNLKRNTRTITNFSFLAGTLCAALALLSMRSDAQWSQTGGPTTSMVTALGKTGSTLYAGVYESYDRSVLYMSTDNGDTWTQRAVMGAGTRINAFASIDEHKYIGTDVGVLYSYGSANFAAVGRTGYVTQFAVSGSTLFFGTLFSFGVFRSTDYGGTWTAVNNGITNFCDRVMAVDGTDLYVAASYDLWGSAKNQIYRSTNNGDTWTALPGNWDSVSAIGALLVRGSNIVVGTSRGFFRSGDKGATWMQTKPGVGVSCLAAKGDTILAGTTNGVYYSTDQGVTWAERGLPYSGISTLLVSGSSIFAGTTFEGLFRSTDNGAHWTRVGTGFAVASNVSVLNASGGVVRAGCLEGLYSSVNNGATWSENSLGVTHPTIRSIAVKGDTVFAGTGETVTDAKDGTGIHRSTDKGATWIPARAGLADDNGVYRDVTAIAMKGDTLFAGLYVRGVFRSTDGGMHWLPVNQGISDTRISALAFSGSVLYAGTIGGGVFRSMDMGGTWSEINGNLTKGEVRALAVIGSDVFAAATGRGILRLTPGGDAWTEVNTGLWSLNPIGLVSAGAKLFAGFYAFGGVFVSSNLGQEWKPAYEGLITQYVTALAASETDLYAGIAYRGVWRRPLSQMATAVDLDVHHAAPEKFELRQNFPNPLNPFNPSTAISFSLASRSFVTLKIYDVMGREVATVISEELPAGTYTRRWDAAHVTSGVYFYRLEAGGFTATKRLILLK